MVYIFLIVLITVHFLTVPILKKKMKKLNPDIICDAKGKFVYKERNSINKSEEFIDRFEVKFGTAILPTSTPNMPKSSKEIKSKIIL